LRRRLIVHSTPSPGELIYVPYFCFNPPSSSIQIFDARTEGSAAPVAVIQGNQTGITAPAAVALDRAENLYVANAASPSPAILVFAKGASGNVAPLRTISGASTQLNLPFGVAVAARGDIFVANEGASSVLRFDATANGDVAPVATIAGSNTGFAPPPLGPLEISHDAAGNAAPIRTIAGDNTQLNGPVQAVFDRRGNIYVSDNTHCYPSCTGAEPFAVTVYSPRSRGNVAPIRSIGGSNTHLYLPAGIAVDAVGNLYTANQQDNSVQIFPPNADGNVTPRIINGSSPGTCVARALTVN
jgi:6-phosphogluconolactonase (cycloisomerase 2 family)